MPGAGNSKASIMLVGEAPGAVEERRGIPFTGPAGQKLHEMLREANISKDEIFVTNVLRCRPPANKLPTSKTEVKGMLDACYPYLRDEISRVRPKVIIPLGNVALLSLTNKEGITKKRGRVIYDDELKASIVPTFHPAAVLRNPHYEDVVVNDFKRVKSLIGGVSVKDSVKYVIANTKELASKLFERLLEVDLFSLDIESDDVILDAPILGIGFSWKEHTGAYLPLVGQNLEDIWGLEYTWVIENLKKVLAGNQEKIAHNGKFDLKLLKRNGIDVNNFCYDTMLDHYLAVTEIQGTHGLKDLAWMYTDMGGYDSTLDVFPWKKEGFRCIPTNVLGEYCCADADVTLRLFSIFRKEIKKEKMEYLSKILVIASRALAEVELTGVRIDLEYLKKLEHEFVETVEKLEKKMREVGKVEDIEKEELSKKQEIARKKYYDSKTLSKRYSEEEYVEKVKLEPFNFQSTKQLRTLFFEKMKFPVLKKTATGSPSTDKETLTLLAQKGKYKIVELLLKHREVNKMLSTYVRGFIPLADKNSRVHTTYLLHGTVSGRLASRSPNLQNIPRDSRIKNAVIASPGQKLIEADYAQAEFRIWAHLSKDTQMLQDIKSGIDIHKKTAATVFRVPVDKVTKEQRQIAKGVTFGLMYGRGIDSVAEEFDISRVEAQKIVNSFFLSYPQAKRWLSKTIFFAKENGYVKNILGRKRRLPDLKSSEKEVVAESGRQAVNSPIQSAASDLTLISLVRMTSRIKKQNKKTNIVLTVHDSIVFDVPEDEVDWVIKNAVEVMEDPIVDLLVPMVAEIKIGERWGSLEEIEND